MQNQRKNVVFGKKMVRRKFLGGDQRLASVADTIKNL